MLTTVFISIAFDDSLLEGYPLPVTVSVGGTHGQRVMMQSYIRLMWTS